MIEFIYLITLEVFLIFWLLEGDIFEHSLTLCIVCCSHLLRHCTTAHLGWDWVQCLPHHRCQVSRHQCLLQQH